MAIDTNPYHYSYFIYGTWKIGKTTFSVNIPHSRIIALEPGHRFVEADPTPLATWEDFKGELRRALKEKKHKILVVDPVDHAFNMCVDHICKERGVSYITDLKFGVGYALVKEEFRRPFWHLIHAGMGLVFLCHEEERTAEVGEMTKTFYRPRLRPMAQEVILPLFDIIGRMYVEMENVGGKMGPQRFLTFCPTDTVVAGDRSGILEAASPIKVEPKDQGWKIIESTFKKEFGTHVDKRVLPEKTGGAASKDGTGGTGAGPGGVPKR